jgi:hypothetical protein
LKKTVLLPLAAILIASPVWSHSQAQTGSIKLSTTALSFNGSSGNVSSQPLTLTVTSSQAVTIRSLTFSNTAFSGPSGTLPATVPTGRSITGQITAHPKTTAQTGKLTISTSAGTYTVSLSETAIAQKPASHSASLTWKAPSSSPTPVDSYQVNRAASGSTAYSVVGTTTAGSTAFTDSSVTSGKSYAYQVRSVDASGHASSPSNTVTLAIP